MPGEREDGPEYPSEEKQSSVLRLLWRQYRCLLLLVTGNPDSERVAFFLIKTQSLTLQRFETVSNDLDQLQICPIAVQLETLVASWAKRGFAKFSLKQSPIAPYRLIFVLRCKCMV